MAARESEVLKKKCPTPRPNPPQNLPCSLGFRVKGPAHIPKRQQNRCACILGAAEVLNPKC